MYDVSRHVSRVHHLNGRADWCGVTVSITAKLAAVRGCRCRLPRSLQQCEAAGGPPGLCLVNALVFESRKKSGLLPENTILIDSVEPLTSDPQGATAKIVFRMVCADRAEQDLVKDKLPQWIKSDSWIVQLEKFLIPACG